MTLLIAQGGAADCLAPCLCVAPSFIHASLSFLFLPSYFSLFPLTVCPLAGRAICYAIIRAYSAQPLLQQLPHQSPYIYPSPAPPPSHWGNSLLNAHCRLMKDLCGAINMKSCCEMRFHLNVIKHTMSLPHTTLPAPPSLPDSISLPLFVSITYSLSLSSRCRWTRK